MSELKPCAHCGGEATFYVRSFQVDKDGYQRRCDQCGADGPWAPTTQEADELWNRRHVVRGCEHWTVGGSGMGYWSWRDDCDHAQQERVSDFPNCPVCGALPPEGEVAGMGMEHLSQADHGLKPGDPIDRPGAIDKAREALERAEEERKVARGWDSPTETSTGTVDVPPQYREDVSIAERLNVLSLDIHGEYASDAHRAIYVLCDIVRELAAKVEGKG